MVSARDVQNLTAAQRDALAGMITEAYGIPPSKIGDGTILAFLMKLLALAPIILPLFMEPKKEGEDRSFADVLAKLLTLLSNPAFIQAILDLFKAPAAE